MGTILKNGIPYGASNQPTAAAVPYSNSTSGLSATNVQSAIDEVGSVTTFNCTLRSGYSLPTWGQCAGVRIGNVVIINVWGLRADAAHTGEAIFADTPYNAASTAGALLSADDQTGDAVMRSSAGSTALYLSRYTTANKNMYGQLVYVVQD